MTLQHHNAKESLDEPFVNYSMDSIKAIFHEHLLKIK